MNTENKNENENEDTRPPRKLRSPEIEEIRRCVRFGYDLQKLRIQQGNRSGSETVELGEDSIAYLAKASDKLTEAEDIAFKGLAKLLKPIPIYDQWLKDQKGVGPRMAGVIVSEFDITRAHAPSCFISYAGLACDGDGKAVRRKKGEKANYNPFLKSKLVKVLGESFIKSRSPWREFYDNYKNRLQHRRVTCMLCEGSGVYDKKTCYNCNGNAHDAPWGRSDMHRHQAAIRYMVKQFLIQLHIKWREVEGLPVRRPYAEEYLGRKHHED